MSTTTPTLGLTLYDSTTDQVVTFATFRAVWGGTASTSNFYKIDTWAGTVNSSISTLQNQRGAITVSASYISTNYYEATVSSITTYTTGMNILLKLDTDSAGTVTLNISSLGIKSVTKVNSSGATVNIASGELQAGRYYLFTYDGTQWVWASANSSDQVYVVSGTSGNFINVASDGSLQDSGYNNSTYAPASKGVTNGDTHNHLGGDGNPITTLPEDINLTGIISPSQITSDQNNYNPSGLSTSSEIRLSSDASRTITGISGGGAGRIIFISNVGSNPIVFSNENSSSSASNRFILSADLTLLSNQSTIIKYDSTSSRWRVVGGVGSSSGGVSVLEVQVFS